MNRAMKLAAAAGLVVAAATSATGAHAAPGISVWGERWAWEGPGVGQIEASTSYVQVLDCRTVLAVENRGDRATRYHRAEGRWPAPSQAAQYPANQTIRTVLDVSHRHGWTMIHSWTDATGHSDLHRVVWVPSCDKDANPLT